MPSTVTFNRLAFAIKTLEPTLTKTFGPDGMSLGRFFGIYQRRHALIMTAFMALIVLASVLPEPSLCLRLTLTTIGFMLELTGHG